MILDCRHAILKVQVFVVRPDLGQCQITEDDGMAMTAVYLPIPRTLVEIWKKLLDHDLLVQDSYPIDEGSEDRLIDEITTVVNVTTRYCHQG